MPFIWFSSIISIFFKFEVKFGLIPKAEAIVCLRMVLFDFRGHNIDMCCAMIDSMGPFLYLSSDSHSKTKILLDVMMKKREKINDPRQQVTNFSKKFFFPLLII